MTPDIAPRVPKWLALGLVAALLASLASMGWLSVFDGAAKGPDFTGLAEDITGAGAAAEAGASSPKSLPASAVQASRFQLQGVVAGTLPEDADGVALIAVDRAPARAFRTGDAVGGDLVLMGISPGGAILGAPHGPPLLVLEVTAGGGAPGTPPAMATQGSGDGAGTPMPTSTAPAAPPERQQPATPIDDTVTWPDADLSARSNANSPAVRPAPGRRLRLQHPNAAP